jgi:hypothetical protein
MNDRENDRIAPAGEPARNRPGIVLLTGHWLSLAGLVLVITTISTWLFFLPAEVEGHVERQR